MENKDLPKIKDASSIRKLNILRVLELCKKFCPMNFDLLISNIEFETGLAEKTAKNYLKILYDTKRIAIDNKGGTKTVKIPGTKK